MNAILKTHSEQNVNMTLDSVNERGRERENATQNIQDNKKEERGKNTEMK